MFPGAACSSRRLGTQNCSLDQSIQAVVPLAEMLSYASTLKSMTSGQGSFTMELQGYEPVPPNVQQQIVDRYQKSRAGVEED